MNEEKTSRLEGISLSLRYAPVLTDLLKAVVDFKLHHTMEKGNSNTEFREMDKRLRDYVATLLPVEAPPLQEFANKLHNRLGDWSGDESGVTNTTSNDGELVPLEQRTDALKDSLSATVARVMKHRTETKKIVEDVKVMESNNNIQQDSSTKVTINASDNIESDHILDIGVYS